MSTADHNIEKISSDEFIAIIDSFSFVFAKTMPQSPHWYSVRKNENADVNFNKVVQFIRDNGYVTQFKGRDYTCFNYNGFQYWTMGAPVHETTILNRAKIN